MNAFHPRKRILAAPLTWALFFLCFDGIFWTLLLLHPMRHDSLIAVDDILQCIGPLLAVPFCLMHLRRRWPDAPLFLGLGILAYVIGQGIWTFYQVIAHQPPFPSTADVAFLASYPLLLLGILYLPTRPLTRISRVRKSLDGMIIMIGIIIFSWYFILGPTLLQDSSSLLEKLVGTAYPCSDLVLLLCVLLLWVNWEDRTLLPILLLLSSGLLVLVLTDSIYDYSSLQNSYAVGNLIDPLWSVSFQLLGLAVLALRRVQTQQGLSLPLTRPSSRPLWQAFLPYAFVPALGLLLLYMWHTPDSSALQPEVYIGTALMICLVLLRQMVAIREIHNLYVNNDALALANKQLEFQANHDVLTNLPNRKLLWEQIQQITGSASPAEQEAALLLLNLDRFKEINDTFGHPLGDRLLRQVGERLQQSVDPTAIVSRISGDEFAIFLPNAHKAAASQAAMQLQKTLEEPFLVNEYPLHIEASIGIALFPVHGNDPLTLCQHADIAMYSAKQAPERRAFYDIHYDQYNPQRLALLGDLRRAMAHNELCLYYQPKAEIHTSNIKSVEALIRWQHPTQGWIRPDQFIPLAEQTGLIGPLTHWVVEAAIMQCKQWLLSGRELCISVNLSMRNLRDANLPATIASLLAHYNVPSHLLCCEITESAVMTDAEHTLNVLNDLLALGIHISIDDYGTGYASLSYLKRFPANELKIDRAFVQHLTTEQADQAIVRSTVSMAHSLGMRVVAEGVEDQATWNLLANLECDIAQGYYLSRPLSASDLENWLDVRQKAASYKPEVGEEVAA